MTTHTRILGTVSGVIALASLAIPAFAATGSLSLKTNLSASASTTRQENMEKRIEKTQDKGSAMIDQRIASLNAVLVRIQAMKNVTDAQKASFATSVQGEISALNALKVQISSDTGTTTLRVDVGSITKSLRIYALVEPQTNIAAAADRVGTLVATMNTLAGKFQTRLAAQPSLANLTALQATLADLNAKASDANTQSQAAVSETVSLKADNGDKTVMASNTAALKDARSKIQAATKDLVAARKDAQTIIEALKKSGSPVSASTTMSVSASASTTGR